MKQFLLRASLVKKNRMLWHISKCFFYPFLCQKHTGILLLESLKEPGRDAGGKTKMWRSSEDWLLLKFSILRVVHIEPLQLVNYDSGFPTLPLVPRKVTALVSYESLYSLSISPILKAIICLLTFLHLQS